MQAHALDDFLSPTAREQLDGLRRTLDERLALLEDALSGRHAGASLEALVLDLARAATDEAQAATELACLEATRERDAALQQLSATELGHEAECRKIEEQCDAQLASVRAQADAAVASERARADAEVSNERARVEDLDRALRDTKHQIAAYVAAEAASNDARARAEEHLTAVAKENADLARQNADLGGKCEALATELARLQASAAEQDRAFRESQERAARDLQGRLDMLQTEKDADAAAHNAEKDEMKKVLLSAKDVFAKLGQQKAAADGRARALEAELERTREALTRGKAEKRN